MGDRVCRQHRWPVSVGACRRPHRCRGAGLGGCPHRGVPGRGRGGGHRAARRLRRCRRPGHAARGRDRGGPFPPGHVGEQGGDRPSRPGRSFRRGSRRRSAARSVRPPPAAGTTTRSTVDPGQGPASVRKEAHQCADRSHNSACRCGRSRATRGASRMRLPTAAAMRRPRWLSVAGSGVAGFDFGEQHGDVAPVVDVVDVRRSARQGCGVGWGAPGARRRGPSASTAHTTGHGSLRCPWHGYEFEVASGRCPADARLKLRSYR
ncbi:MAG: hypothetical protein JWR81_3178 [Pseudonocardia sp.]|nr:hypothetical protein [Pseudonocardia sp.]